MLDGGEIAPETLFWRDGMVDWQPLRTIISVYLRLSGESKGPYSESQVRDMLGKNLVGLGTLGRRNTAAEWEPLATLLGAPGAKPAHAIGARPAAGAS